MAASANNYDVQGLALLAFDGGLLAADIVAQELLGRWWWLPLLALAGSVVMCIRVVSGRPLDVGKRLSAAMAEYRDLPESHITALLVDELVGTLERSEVLVREKATALSSAVRWLGLAGPLTLPGLLA